MASSGGVADDLRKKSMKNVRSRGGSMAREAKKTEEDIRVEGPGTDTVLCC